MLDYSQTMSTSRSLSKDALYAPLSSYINEIEENTDDGSNNPSTTKAKNIKPRSLGAYHLTGNSIPTNLRQSSLVDWIEKVSNHYHTTRFNSGASKSLRKSHIESRLLQRSMLMIGGGIHNPSSSLTALSATSTDGKKRLQRKMNWRQKRGERVVSNKKRKKTMLEHPRDHTQRQDQNDKISNEISDKDKIIDPLPNDNVESSKSQSETSSRITSKPSLPLPTTNLLSPLHQMWSQYVTHLTQSCTNVQEISQRISKIEWAGAIVRILECPALVQPQQTREVTSTEKKRKRKRKLKHKILGMDAMILSETKNTWKMTPISLLSKMTGSKDGMKKENKGKNVDKNTSLFPLCDEDVIMIPKRNTKLAMKMFVSSNCFNQNVENGKKHENKRKTQGEDDGKIEIQIIVHGQGD